MRDAGRLREPLTPCCWSGKASVAPVERAVSSWGCGSSCTLWWTIGLKPDIGGLRIWGNRVSIIDSGEADPLNIIGCGMEMLVMLSKSRQCREVPEVTAGRAAYA